MKDEKGFKQVKNGSKGKTPDRQKKRIPVGVRGFFSHKCPDRLWAHPAYLMAALSLGLKRPGA
jgi:hypothetical protein